jgi:hypothetical protein
MKKTELVYFFRQNGTNYVKIGYTTKSDVKMRFTQFCTYAPFGGKVLGVIKTESGITTERQIHNELAHRRLKGEFFNISEDDCNKIIYRYNSDEMNCIISNFNIWLCNEKSNIESLNDLFKKAINPVKQEENNQLITDLILKYFNREQRTVWMTSTEVMQYILDKEQLDIKSMKIFGSCLSGIFGKSKSKNTNGIVRNKYYVGLNN